MGTCILKEATGGDGRGRGRGEIMRSDGKYEMIHKGRGQITRKRRKQGQRRRHDKYSGKDRFTDEQDGKDERAALRPLSIHDPFPCSPLGVTPERSSSPLNNTILRTANFISKMLS